MLGKPLCSSARSCCTNLKHPPIRNGDRGSCNRPESSGETYLFHTNTRAESPADQRPDPRHCWRTSRHSWSGTEKRNCVVILRTLPHQENCPHYITEHKSFSSHLFTSRRWTLPLKNMKREELGYIGSFCLRMDLASVRPACMSVPSRAKKGCTTVWYHSRARLQAQTLMRTTSMMSSSLSPI